MSVIRGRLPKRDITATTKKSNTILKEDAYLAKEMKRIDEELFGKKPNIKMVQPTQCKYNSDRSKPLLPGKCRRIIKDIGKVVPLPEVVIEPPRHYNPPASAASFDVEKPYIGIPTKKEMTPIQLKIEKKHQQEANEWRLRIRKSSQKRAQRRGKKRAKKYAYLTAETGFPIYRKNYPNAPKFTAPLPTENAAIIYALIDPSDNTLRYVGRTANLAQRSKDHMKYEQGNPALWKWKTSIDFKFSIFIICRVSWRDRKAAEQEWIAYFRQIGYIYNIQKGG